MKKRKIISLVCIFCTITAFQNCSNLSESQISSIIDNPNSHLLEDEFSAVLNDTLIDADTPDNSSDQAVSFKASSSSSEPGPHYDYTTDVLENLKSRRKIYLERLDRETDAYWGLNDVLNTAYELYGIEKDVRVLVFLLETGEELVKHLSSAKKQKDFLYGRPVHAWLSWKYSCKQGYAMQVTNMLLIDNVAFAMYELLGSSTNRAKYTKRIKKLTATYEKVFRHFKSSYRAKLKSYVFSPHEKKLSFCSQKDYNRQAGTILPQNMNAAASLAHYRMYRLQSRLKRQKKKAYHKLHFSQTAILIRTAIKGWRVGKRNGYQWNYWNTKKVSIRGDDSPHALLTMRLIVALNEHGWTFSNTYIKKLGETFHILYNNGKTARSHLGSLRLTSTEKYLRVLADMSFVSRYDKSISSRIKYLIREDSAGKYSYAEVSYLKYSLK